MARNGSGVYSLPAGSTVTNGDTSDASDLNTPLQDLETDANTARPVVAGGTGATTALGAMQTLGATDATQTGDHTFSGALTFSGNNSFTGNNTFTGVGGFFHAVKDADQTRNSTTTLADDSALTISLPVGRFTFEAVLFSAAGAGALKYGWTVPASTSMRWNTPQSTPALYLNETQTLTVSDTSTNGIMTELKGNVRILTAGTFALQWAQNASNAADTSVLLNSWMRLQKLE